MTIHKRTPSHVKDSLQAICLTISSMSLSKIRTTSSSSWLNPSCSIIIAHISALLGNPYCLKDSIKFFIGSSHVSENGSRSNLNKWYVPPCECRHLQTVMPRVVPMGALFSTGRHCGMISPCLSYTWPLPRGIIPRVSIPTLWHQHPLHMLTLCQDQCTSVA